MSTNQHIHLQTKAGRTVGSSQRHSPHYTADAPEAEVGRRSGREFQGSGQGENLQGSEGDGDLQGPEGGGDLPGFEGGGDRQRVSARWGPSEGLGEW